MVAAEAHCEDVAAWSMRFADSGPSRPRCYIDLTSLLVITRKSATCCSSTCGLEKQKLARENRYGTTESSRHQPSRASKSFMKIDLGPAGWSAPLLGMAGLSFAIVREQRISKAMRELKGKVVLVTGGSRGLGYAIARELALSGARLALTSRPTDELERAKARLLASGPPRRRMCGYTPAT